MQDWSEAKKRILKCSESDWCSDLFFISGQKSYIESSLASTLQIAPIATLSEYTSAKSSQHTTTLQPDRVSKVVQQKRTHRAVQKHPL